MVSSDCTSAPHGSPLLHPLVVFLFVSSGKGPRFPAMWSVYHLRAAVHTGGFQAAAPMSLPVKSNICTVHQSFAEFFFVFRLYPPENIELRVMFRSCSGYFFFFHIINISTAKFIVYVQKKSFFGHPCSFNFISDYM